MTAVRPPVFPTASAAARPQAADPAKLAAQRAFFQQALGQAQAPRAAAAPLPAAPPQAAAKAAVQPAKIPDPAADPPARPLRPGSLLDIRV